MFLNASCCCWKLNKNRLSLSEFKKRGIVICCKETITVLQFLSKHFAYQTPIHHHSQLTQFKGVHWSLLTLTRNILWTNKLAKRPFFVASSRLCRHCRNLAEGGCLLTQFHFTLCRDFFGSCCLLDLTWKGPRYTGYQFWSEKVRAIVLSEKREKAGLFGALLFFHHWTCTSTSRSDIKLICLSAYVSQN